MSDEGMTERELEDAAQWHGDARTPNTGDERDREMAREQVVMEVLSEWYGHVGLRCVREVLDALDAVRSPQGEDHEAADDEYGECGVLNPGWQKGVPQAGDHEAGLVHCVGCDDKRCEGIEDPSRDGTVAYTHVCMDCGALGIAGGYHDHGGGNAGDTIALAQLPDAIRSLQQFEQRAIEAEEELARDGTVAVEDVARLERIASALAVLVNLKDGPRDDAYERDKPAAWQEAREALGWHASTTDHDQATKEGDDERRP